jgi:hypothetical protein
MCVKRATGLNEGAIVAAAFTAKNAVDCALCFIYTSHADA